jgi:hypothetical protein
MGISLSISNSDATLNIYETAQESWKCNAIFMGALYILYYKLVGIQMLLPRMSTF